MQTETHAEGRDATPHQRVDGAGDVEISRRAGAGGEHGQVRLHVVVRLGGEAAAQGDDLGAGLAQIVRQRVDEGVLVIDEQHAAPRGRARSRHQRPALVARGPADRVEEGRGLQLGLGLFRVGLGIEEQGGARAHLGDPVLHADRPQGEAGVEVAVEAEHAHGAAVPRARRALVILDELHGPRLGRARHRDRPRMGEEGVEGVELGPEPALHVIHGVDEPGVHLDLTATDHAHAAGHADARLVVAVDVGAHRQLGLVLGRGEQGDDLGRVADGIMPTGDRPRDRAGLHTIPVDPHVHLRRGPDEILRVAEVHEEAVRRRVALAQPEEQLGRGRRAGLEEGLAGDDLEEITALERLSRHAHHGRVLAPLVVAPSRRLRGRDVGRGRPLAGKIVRRVAADLELVTMAGGQLAAVIDDHQLVGQVEDEVALGR